MSGSSLITKGLVSDAGTQGSTALSVLLPSDLGVNQATSDVQQDASVLVIIPTAINVCLMVVENITDNLRAQQVSDIVLPSLYKRAYLMVYETDEVALIRQ